MEAATRMRKFTDNHGRTIGTLHDDGIFRKVVSGEKHLFQSRDAWGMDVDVLRELPPETEIRIKDKDDGVVYITTCADFRSGALIEYGYGAQMVFWRGCFDRVVDRKRIKSSYIDSWRAQIELWNSVPRKG